MCIRDSTYFFTDVQALDICDEQAIRAFVTDNRVDVIVNCAAYTAVDKAEDNPALCDKLTHLAPGYLAAAAEACGAAMIQVSTDYVFDGIGPVSYTHLDVYKRQRMYLSGRIVAPPNKAGVKKLTERFFLSIW